MVESLKPWLERNTIGEKDITLEGEPAARRFTLRVGGSKGFAERKVAQMLGSLKEMDGTFEKFYAHDMDGAAHEIVVSGLTRTRRWCAKRSASRRRRQLLPICTQ